MAHDLTDPLERRLRASRPDSAVPEDAFDPALLAHVHGLPVARRHSVPRRVALPVVAGAAVTATAAVMLIGGPGGAGGPTDAEAIAAQTLHWLSPAAGTVLHTRAVEHQGRRSATFEVWQSGDDPTVVREKIVDPGGSVERAGNGLYDPSTNTIYVADPDGSSKGPGDSGAYTQAGDGIVNKVRTLLQGGQMEVSGPVTHDGVEAWAVALKADEGRPVWTLWVSAADGRPLELRDPGRDASEAPQEIEWPVYEVLSNPGADDLLTLTGAHPGAQVVRDRTQVQAAWDAIGPKQIEHDKTGEVKPAGGPAKG